MMKSAIFCIFFCFFGGFEKCAIAQSQVKNIQPISFQKARVLAVSEFNLQTGDKYKVFRCTLFDQTNNDWLFVFDEFVTPPLPGGSVVFIYISKKTGKAVSNWGK